MDAAVALHPESGTVRRQRHVAVAGGLLLGLGALALSTESWRHGALLVIGALLGVSLYHAAFGFTSAYRRALVERDVAGVLAQPNCRIPGPDGSSSGRSEVMPS